MSPQLGRGVSAVRLENGFASPAVVHVSVQSDARTVLGFPNGIRLRAVDSVFLILHLLCDSCSGAVAWMSCLSLLSCQGHPPACPPHTSCWTGLLNKVSLPLRPDCLSAGQTSLAQLPGIQWAWVQYCRAWVLCLMTNKQITPKTWQRTSAIQHGNQPALMEQPSLRPLRRTHTTRAVGSGAGALILLWHIGTSHLPR